MDCTEDTLEPYLKGDVLVPHPDLQLLPTIFVLLGPLSIIFPARRKSVSIQWPTRFGRHQLHDLACLDDTLDLLHQQTAHAH